MYSLILALAMTAPGDTQAYASASAGCADGHAPVRTWLAARPHPVRNFLSHFLHPKAAGCAGGSASVSYRAAASTGCAGSSAAMSYSYSGPAVPAPALPSVKTPQPKN